MGGIECSALEGGCRNNEMIEDIEKYLNTKLKQEIYCPIDDKIEIEIIKICNNLKKSDFYKFGQKILCNLLLKYGFKLNLLVNLKKADVNDIDGIITIRIFLCGRQDAARHPHRRTVTYCTACPHPEHSSAGKRTRRATVSPQRQKYCPDRVWGLFTGCLKADSGKSA